jgi:hypothetical protein
MRIVSLSKRRTLESALTRQSKLAGKQASSPNRRSQSPSRSTRAGGVPLAAVRSGATTQL